MQCCCEGGKGGCSRLSWVRICQLRLNMSIEGDISLELWMEKHIAIHQHAMLNTKISSIKRHLSLTLPVSVNLAARLGGGKRIATHHFFPTPSFSQCAREFVRESQKSEESKFHSGKFPRGSPHGFLLVFGILGPLMLLIGRNLGICRLHLNTTAKQVVNQSKAKNYRVHPKNIV